MGHPTIVILLCSLSILSVAAIGQGKGKQAPKDSNLHIESLMTAADFKSCGLNKLTPDEIAHLDAWLTSFGKRIAIVVGDNPQAQSSTDVIETEIDGEFQGWDGETIFKLANGQIWQQAECDYEYEYAYRPEVLI